MSFPGTGRRLLLYAITDRKHLRGREVEGFARDAGMAGIDMLQIREKDLSDAELYSLVLRAVKAVEGSGMRVLVNDRLDVALAAGAQGVHLGGHSAPTEVVRAAVPEGFIIGVSTHNRQEALLARAGGADFITFGPVFPTPYKDRYGPPVGTEALARLCDEIEIKVLPLGGINEENYLPLLHLPISGLAAISLFQNAVNLGELVGRIRETAEARE
jgi:thiamine-phosphate pyrophosphorylase